MISENSLYGVNNGTVSLHAWFVLLSQTGSFFTGGERFMPHEGGNQLMLQGWLLGPLLFHMSQGRTPAGNLNAYFSILKKLMNTASMAKHFNQPLPAVPTFKKKGRGRGGNVQVYQKSFSEDQPWLRLCSGPWEVGKGRAEGSQVEGCQYLVPKDVLWPLCLLNKLSTFWFFTCWSSSSAYGLEVKNKEICIHYHT